MEDEKAQEEETLVEISPLAAAGNLKAKVQALDVYLCTNLGTSSPS